MTSKISKIKLSTYSTYAKLSKLEMATIPVDLSHLLPEHQFPEGAVTALYGHNHATGMASRAFDLAEKQGLDVSHFEMYIDNYNWTIQTIGLEATDRSPALREMNVLTLNRCRKDLKAIVLDYWAGFIKKVSITPEQLRSFDGQDPLFATTRPDFIGYLHSKAEFKHLDAITFRARTMVGLVSMASVFKRRSIMDITTSFGQSTKGKSRPKFADGGQWTKASSR